MAKKTLQNEKDISKDISFYKMEQFNSEICKLKHVSIDKELKNIEINNSKRHKEDDEKHKELMDIMQGLRENINKDTKENIENTNEQIKEDIKNDYNNLKDKIVLTEKSIGEKIDKLNEFDDSLRGNGNPGIWESIRNLRWKFRVSIALILVILIITLGGNFRGITFEKIKKVFGTNKQVENKQVENKQVENKQVENK